MPWWIPDNIASFGANFYFPQFGIGHGHSRETLFFPTRTAEEWRNQEGYWGEVAYHKVIDFLGAAALLGIRLESVHARVCKSDHLTDLKFLSALTAAGAFHYT